MQGIMETQPICGIRGAGVCGGQTHMTLWPCKGSSLPGPSSGHGPFWTGGLLRALAWYSSTPAMCIPLADPPILFWKNGATVWGCKSLNAWLKVAQQQGHLSCPWMSSLGVSVFKVASLSPLMMPTQTLGQFPHNFCFVLPSSMGCTNATTSCYPKQAGREGGVLWAQILLLTQRKVFPQSLCRLPLTHLWLELSHVPQAW